MEQGVRRRQGVQVKSCLFHKHLNQASKDTMPQCGAEVGSAKENTRIADTPSSKQLPADEGSACVHSARARVL